MTIEALYIDWLCFKVHINFLVILGFTTSHITTKVKSGKNLSGKNHYTMGISGSEKGIDKEG